MTRVKIKSIHGENFMSYKDRKIELGDKNVLSGRNRAGKTTSAHLTNWVLFNKDFYGRESKDIRPHDSDGNNIDYIDITGTLTLDIDGREVEIKKVQKQKWKKKDGSFDGNFNILFLNGNEKSEKDFKAYLEEIVPEETFLFCSNAQNFVRLDANKRREKLFSIIPTYTSEQVIEKFKEFEPIRNYLRLGTPEEINIDDAIAAVKRKLNGKGRGDKGLHGELDTIPIRIDEISKQIEDTRDIENKIIELKEQMEEFQEQEQELDNISMRFDSVSKSISELKQKQFRIEQQEEDKLNTQLSAVKDSIWNLVDEQSQIETKISSNIKQISSFESSIATKEGQRKALGERWISEKTKNFDESELVCKYCGQEFPHQKQEEMKQKFEIARAETMKSIEVEGNKVSDEINGYKEFIVKLQSENTKFKDKLQEIEKSIDEKQNLMNELPQEVDLSKNEEYQALSKEIEEKTKSLSSEQENEISFQKKEIRQRLNKISSQIAELNQKIETVNSAKTRVAELEQERKEVAQKIANTEQELDLLKSFNKKKVELITEKINQEFKVVQFRMFEQQVNGDYKETCQMLVNGTSYDGKLNTGDKLLAELDLVSTFQRINGISVPVFLDNAGEVDPERIPQTDFQLIMLQRADAEGLTVETE